MGQSFRRLLCLAVVVLLLPTYTLSASAQDYYARLESLHFDITLFQDGSAEIIETRIVSFNGDHQFTRYGVSNFFAGPRKFNGWAVFLDDLELTMLDAPDNENRPENTFTVEDGEGQNTVCIYHRSIYTTRTFRICYQVENAVKLYSDVAEFHWNLTGEDGISSIDHLSATLRVPEGIAEEEFRIWAHGPLNGTFEKVDTSTADLNVDYVPYGTVVDLRTAMPAEFFSGGWIQEGDALPGILEEETALAESANAKREEEAREQAERDAYWEAYWVQRESWESAHPILTSIEGFCEDIYDFFYFNIEDRLPAFVGGISACVFGVSIVFGKRKNNPRKRRHFPAQSPAYYRSLPDRRPAPAVDWLLHFYKEDGSAGITQEISAAMLELNLKKLIRFRTDGRNTQIFLNRALGNQIFSSISPLQSGQSFRVQIHTADGKADRKSNGVDITEAAGYLETLWHFLLEAAEDSDCISMEDLKSYVSRHQENAYHFRSSFEQAVGRAFSKGIGTEYLESPPLIQDKRLLILPAVVGVLAMVIRGLSTLYDGVELGAALLVGIISLAVAMVFLAAYCLGQRLSVRRDLILDQKSENARALWLAFGRFLDDFTTFDRKELPEFPVWREYMVYAVAMGKGPKVAKALVVKYPECFHSADDIFDDEYYRMLEDMRFYEALDAVSQEVAVARPPEYHSASGSADSWSENWSDSSGGGGGFSDSTGGSDSGSGGDFAD